MELNLEHYQGKNIHIVGISGIEGYSVAKFFLERGINTLTFHDYSEKEDFRKNFFSLHLYMKRQERRQALDALDSSGCRFYYKSEYLRGIERADIIFLSQNWFAYTPNKPLFNLKKENPEKFRFLIQLYFEFKRCCIIGVTGTNGKSTTVDLITKMLQKSERQVWYGGNERSKEQALLSLDEIQKDDVLVLEISNRHLKESPLGGVVDIAVVTNITNNHIVDHGSLEAYQKAKQSIIAGQSSQQKVILNRDDTFSRQWGQKLLQQSDSPKVSFFSLIDKNEKISAYWGKEGIVLGEQVLKINNITYLPQHFRSNALAAGLATLRAGGQPQAIAKVVETYQGLRGRTEFVGEKAGVKYINDIKSTVPQATLSALSSFPQPVILILGGDDKGGDFVPLSSGIIANARYVCLLPGTVSQQVSKLIREKGYMFFDFYTNINEVWEKVSDLSRPGDVVLLSPAGEGFYSQFIAGQKGIRDYYKSLPE